MKRNTSNNIKLVLTAGILLTTLPGCKFTEFLKDKFGKKQSVEKTTFKQEEFIPKKENQGAVLATINDKPVLYKDEFDNHLNQMLQAYPQLKGSLSAEALPAGLKTAVLNKLVEQELIFAWAKKNNIEDDQEFQKAYKEAIQNLKRLMYVNQFEKLLLNQISISDTEVREEYDKNKNRYIKAYGGVLTYGVSFEKPQDAKEFFEKAKDKTSEFSKIAQEDKKGKFKELGRISENSFYVPEQIKDAVLKITTFPSIIMVNTDKETWVIDAVDKKDTEYRSFDEIRADLENAVKGKHFQELLDKKMKELKNEFTVKVFENLIMTPQNKTEQFNGGIPMLEPEQEEAQAKQPVTQNNCIAV